MLSKDLILCHSLLLLPSVFPTIILFQRVDSSHQVAKVLELQNCTNSPSNEYLGLISFRIDWFDFLAVQETLKSLLQHHKQKASILWCSAFSMDQLSHTYMITGEAIALIIWTLVGKVISLLFNILCGFVIYFHPRSKSLLISWLQSLSTGILECKKRKSVCLHIFLFYLA